MYDEDEPSDAELEKREAERLINASEVTIAGIPAEALETILRAAVERAIGWKAREQAKELLDKMIREAAAEAVATASTEFVQKRVAAILDGPIQEYDRWGDQKGSSKTLKSMVMEQLAAETKPDRYNHDPGGTIVTKAVHAKVGEILNSNDFKTIVEEAKKKFRSSVDNLIVEKLRETLKSALGLR